MAQTLSILMYGRDAQLLETRRMVLETSGHKVRTTMDLSEIDRIAAFQNFDLLILCHSLSMEQCGRALALAHSRWPSVESLILTAGAAGCTTPLTERVLDAMQGPAKLISTVGQIAKSEASLPAHAY